jgi:hypothetical protein
MIEISDKKYWKKLNYNDGMLYVALLEIDGTNDWRMIRDGDEHYETVDFDSDEIRRCFKTYSMWYSIDCERYAKGTLDMNYWVIPVRDI